MATAISFLTQTPSLNSCSVKTKKAIPNSLPSTQLKLNAIRRDGMKQSVFINRKITRSRPYHIVASSDISDDSSVEHAASDLPLRDGHGQDPGKLSDLPLEGSHGPHPGKLSDLPSEDSHGTDPGKLSDLPSEGSHSPDPGKLSDLPPEDSHGPDPGKLSASKIVREFYNCINGKNVGRLAELISENCFFDDYSFPETFAGKKEVCAFFDKLIKAMGGNVKFQIEEVCEADGFIACATWHLEWNEDKIPFTRGCSFFKCSMEGDKLVIREAQVLIESPVKPGGPVVTLLKLVTSVFDDFPNFTKWFLKSPEALLNMLVTIYNLVVAPFINPLLMFYTHIWMILCTWFGYTIAFLRYIAKLFK